MENSHRLKPTNELLLTKISMRKILLTVALITICGAKTEAREFDPPVMGWSSWNTYHVNISDSLICQQADVLVKLGLDKLGYDHINIDDGFFGFRDSTGLMHPHPERFPKGMRKVADYIHSLGLKAGIYSDAGANTCGSRYDDDENGFGAGLYGHERQDARLYFRDWGFDYIKIDYCGAGTWLDLEEEERYKTICDAIKEESPHQVSVNICRWAFPGTWAADMAASWRISSDIRPRWDSIKKIIGKNLYLSAYCRNGHYNDMDMLEIGRGLDDVEERTHMGMWCMMSSPLLIGCDMNKLSAKSLKLLGNEHLISIDQDPLGLQAYVAYRQEGGYVMVKDVGELRGKTRAVALYNPTDSDIIFSLRPEELELSGETKATRVLSCSEERDALPLHLIIKEGENAEIPVCAHGTEVMLLTGSKRTEPYRYEAEWAYMPLYNDLGKRKLPAKYVEKDGVSGGACIANVGGSEANNAQWNQVWSDEGGAYSLTVNYISEARLKMEVSVNGKQIGSHYTGTEADGSIKSVTFDINLEKGYNTIGIGSRYTLVPMLDNLVLEKR